MWSLNFCHIFILHLISTFVFSFSFANSIISSDSLVQVIAASSFGSNGPHLEWNYDCFIDLKGKGVNVFNSLNTLVILNFLSSGGRQGTFMFILVGNNPSILAGFLSWCFLYSAVSSEPFLSLNVMSTWVVLISPPSGIL